MIDECAEMNTEYVSNKVLNIKFHENLFSGTQTVTYRWADRHSKSRSFIFSMNVIPPKVAQCCNFFISYCNSNMGDA
jgi:hypothetical protein